jgi:glyoxylase-like metal-dependent hydrolase (beta-lactamase superfamily II)
MTDQVMAAVRKISDKPVLYIINTHLDADHTGGNAKIAASGKTLTGGNVAGDLADAGEGAAVFAHENTLNHMVAPAAGGTPAPEKALPTETYHIDQMRLSPLYHFGEAVQIIHQPAAHTDGDSMVYLRRADVIATGDIFMTDRYPVIDLANGGSINGIIEGLNRILDLAFPDFRLEGGTLIIPGHGRLSDSADVAYYRDMVTIVRDRIQDMVKKDRSLEQVKAAKPTSDYDARYGKGDAFVEGVYRSLSRGK